MADPQQQQDLLNNPVFIVGAPRSGTSWLNWMLASHPAVVGGPETNFFLLEFGEAIRKFRAGAERNWPHSGLHHYIDETTFLNCIRETWSTVFRDRIAGKPGARLLVEKTPKHGAYIDVIRIVFPTARFVHCYRDSLACVASHLAAGRTWAGERAPKTAWHGAKLWRRRVAEIEQSLRELDPDACRHVSYEALKRDPATTLHGLFAWLQAAHDGDTVKRIVDENNRQNLEKKLAEDNFDSFVATPSKQAERRLNWGQRLIVRCITREWRRRLRAEHG